MHFPTHSKQKDPPKPRPSCSLYMFPPHPEAQPKVHPKDTRNRYMSSLMRDYKQWARRRSFGGNLQILISVGFDQVRSCQAVSADDTGV